MNKLIYIPNQNYYYFCNYRVKTGNSKGGQYNHQGFNLSKKDAEKLIEENKIEVREITHIIKGDSKKKPLVKYRYELEIKQYIERHVFKYEENAQENLPKEFYTDITYGNSIKSLSIHLGCYNVIAYNKLSDFFSVISNNILNISNGTLVNFVKEFSKKSKDTIANLENSFLNRTTGYTDETGTKFEKQKLYVRNYSNEENVVYKVIEAETMSQYSSWQIFNGTYGKYTRYKMAISNI